MNSPTTPIEPDGRQSNPNRLRARRVLAALAASLALTGAGELARAQAPADFNGDGYSDLAMGVPLEDVGTVSDAGAVNVLYGSALDLATTGAELWHQNKAGILDAAEANDEFGSALAWGDFNADDFTDLAIGARGEGVAPFSSSYAGAVHVLYGSLNGLSANGDQFWTQATSGVQDNPEDNDFFGSALAAGDFDGDGYADLAIGIEGEDVSPANVLDAGAVTVLYGTPSGLSAAGTDFWTQDSPSVEDAAQPGDGFGETLAAGDFDEDGFDELAIGVPREDLTVRPIGTVSNVGAVQVLVGTASGLAASSSGHFWHQNSTGVPDAPEASDFFGLALAAGDFDADGDSDLAIGVPFEDVGPVVDAGAVNVLYGGSSGLTGTGSEIWNQDSPDMGDLAQSGDRFGSALAAGDFNTGPDDLAIGVPFEDFTLGGTIPESGMVQVIYGAGTGLESAGNQLWFQPAGSVETGDIFGSAVATGDFDANGHADLAASAPREGIGNKTSVGGVTVIYGQSTGLDAAGSQFWHQNVNGVPDAAEDGDFFGVSLQGP